MPKSMLTSKFQTTVPKAVRKQLGLRVADELTWEVRGDEVVVRPASRAFLERRGMLADGPSPAEALRQMRQQRGSR